MDGGFDGGVLDGGTVQAVNIADVLVSDPSGDVWLTLINMLSKAVENGDYMMAAGLLLTLVGIFIKFVIIPRIKDGKYAEYIVLINLALSVLVGFAAWFLNPKLKLAKVMFTSVSATVVASGGWEVFVKPSTKLFKKIKSKRKQLKEDKK